jgi:hypothetical protein
VFAIPGVILGILAFFMKDYRMVAHVDDRGHEQGFISSMLTLLRIPTLRRLHVGVGIRNIAHYSLLTWLTAYSMRSQGIAEDKAGPAVGVITLMAVFGAVLGGAWGPVVVGAISDALGGGAEGLNNALIIICLSGFVAAFVEWRGARTYPADMGRVKGVALQAA